MSERREHERYTLWFPVTVDSDAHKVWAVCKDVSVGGILISGSGGLDVGRVVTLRFRVSPEGPERTLTGRIVRVDAPDTNPRSVWPYKMAIEFLEPDARLQSLFARASSRPPPPP